MAIYHLSAKILSRSKGYNAVAASAYRSGEKIQDMQTGKTYDYSNRKGVAYSTILTPAGAPEWAKNRSALANAVEKKENGHNRRATARLFREVELALARELSLEQNKELLLGFVRDNFVSRGMIADIAIHTDLDNHNPHAHILLTTREITPDGFGKKNRNWDKKERLKQWREDWEEKLNAALEENDSKQRVDSRSYAERDMDKIPTVHLGKDAWHAERQGMETIRGNRNRWAQQRNDDKVINLEEARRRLRKVEEQIGSAQIWENTQMPLEDVPVSLNKANNHWRGIHAKHSDTGARYTGY